MIPYAAFLRAVNVGGRTVKMDELKTIFAMPGFEHISTYIQSGNMLFQHREQDTAKLTEKIEKQLLKALQYDVKVMLRTANELTAIVKANPFAGAPEHMGVNVTLLSRVPDAAQVSKLMQTPATNEQAIVLGQELYLLCPKGAYSDSVFSNKFIEKQLGVSATTRNWNTITKILGKMME